LLAGVGFFVLDVRQGASGGSYVVSYRAEVEAAPGDASAVVEVVSTIPEDAHPVSLSHTIEYIRLEAAPFGARPAAWLAWGRRKAADT
jgi:hypothetical protein